MHSGFPLDFWNIDLLDMDLLDTDLFGFVSRPWLDADIPGKHFVYH